MKFYYQYHLNINITKTYLLIYKPLDFKQYSIHKVIISIIIIVQFKVNLNNLMFNFNNY